MWLTCFFWLGSVAMLLGSIATIFETNISNRILKIARHGRTSLDINAKPIVLFDIPKRLFTHFYIFGSIFTTLIFYGYYFQSDLLRYYLEKILGSPPCFTSSSALVHLLFSLQIYRRLYECLYISKFSPLAKMNAGVYIGGILHYFGSVVLIFGGSAGCFEINWGITILGIIIFFYGWIKELEAHTILANLRTHDGDASYKIPCGGWFEYVSCANYLAEVIIYFSLALIFQFQNAEFNAVFAWVLANQMYAATIGHQWYQNKFGSKYPNNRKRLIPYIF